MADKDKCGQRVIMGFVVSLLTLCGPIYTSAQIQWDDAFENGNLDTAYLDAGSYVLWPITNLHARVTNASGQQPAFKIYDSLGYQLRPYHHMVYRYEGSSDWHFFDTAHKTLATDYYHFYNQSAFTRDTVYLSYWYPYTYSDLEDYLNTISGSTFVHNLGSKGHSYQGRNIYGYSITDTAYDDCAKSSVVITARQHPVEHINGYFVEGFSNYLLDGTDTVADFLRRNYQFFIYPMINPDGVVNGSGQNALGQGLNREWADSLSPGGTPEIDTIRPVIWHETGQKVDWSIDIHANAGSNIPYYWWGYTGASPVPAWQQAKALEYAQAVAAWDTSSLSGTSLFQNYIQGNGVNTSNTAANWFRKSFDAIAFTFEPTTEPLGPTGDNALLIDNLRSAGASLAKGFYNVFDTVSALVGSISQTSGALILSASGGEPPYTYEWIGPDSSSSDTLLDPKPGNYVGTVTDARGCAWQDEVEVLATGINIDHFDTKIELYPNPSQGSFVLDLGDHTEDAEVMITNLEGRTVFVKSHLSTRLIPLRLKVPAGVYFVRVTSEVNVDIQRLVIQ